MIIILPFFFILKLILCIIFLLYFALIILTMIDNIEIISNFRNNKFNIYLMNNEDFNSRNRIKYGYSKYSENNESLINRLHGDDTHHTEYCEYMKIYEFEITNKYSDSKCPKEPDKLFSSVIKKDCIKGLENYMNVELPHMNNFKQYLFNSDKLNARYSHEFMNNTSESINEFDIIMKTEFPKLGLIFIKEYSEEEINQISQSPRNRITEKDKESESFINLLKDQNKPVFPLKCKEIRPNSIQKEILNLRYFDDKDKGTIILPCGTGKSLLSLFLREQINANLTLIGVPSLNLVEQFYQDCLKFCNSNKIIRIGSRDDFNYDLNKLNLIVKSGGIILTTYHSSKKLLELDFKVDFKVADECHHLVGHKYKLNKSNNDKTNDNNLNDNQISEKEISDFKKFLEIKSHKSLFMTATQKTLTNYDENNNVCMKESDLFGDIICEKSIKWAIENKYIVDYEFGILHNTKLDLENLIKHYKIKVNHSELFFSALMTLKSILKKKKLTHLLIYSNTTENSDIVLEYLDKLLNIDEFKSLKDVLYCKSLHSKKHFDFNEEVDNFTKSKYGIICCVQIFGEGVNIPKLNGVVLSETMVSNIRIIQSLLRPHRREKGNPDKLAYILCPYLDDNTGNYNNRYNKIKDIIGVLRNQDENIENRMKLYNLNERSMPIDPNSKTNKINFTLDNNQNLLNIIKTRFRKSKLLKTDLTREQLELIELKDENKILNIKTKDEYIQSEELRDFYIAEPDKYFKIDWNGWYDFLNIDTSHFIQDKQDWIMFCKNINIKSITIYQEKIKEYKELPEYPEEIYKNFNGICHELGLLSTRRRR